LVFVIAVAALAGIGLFEYYALVRHRQISPETIGGILSGVLVVLSGALNEPELTNLFLYGGMLMVSALHIVRGVHSVAGLASSAFGVVYVGWLGAHVTLLHGKADIGPGLATMLFCAVFLTDTGAYLFGSLFGRTKLAPKVSPKKSWEGAAGGLVSCMAALALVWWLGDRYALTQLPDWPLHRYLTVALIISIVSQVGDLAQSCLKRDAGVKDAGVLFPGHGGVLDRCDGLLFAAPVMYYVIY
jgi:phosphatidate cytidylyltransferase